MEIKTRFSINDKVWTVGQRFNEEKDDFEFVPNPTPRIVKHIKFWHDEKCTDITYLTEYLDGSRDISYYCEQNCFATEEEAQKECDKRNKGE